MLNELFAQRALMETHLRLHGWVPVSYGAAGARQDNCIMYAYRNRDGVLHTAYQYIQIGIVGTLQRYDVDEWYIDDDAFWAMAHVCIAFDSDSST